MKLLSSLVFLHTLVKGFCIKKKLEEKKEKTLDQNDQRATKKFQIKISGEAAASEQTGTRTVGDQTRAVGPGAERRLTGAHFHGYDYFHKNDFAPRSCADYPGNDFISKHFFSIEFSIFCYHYNMIV